MDLDVINAPPSKPAPAKKSRVLHVTFNMGIGGTEQVIRQLVSHLPKDAYDNEILCIDGNVGEIGEMLRHEGVTVTALQRQPGFDRALTRGIRALIRSRRIDLVHCHQYTPWIYGLLSSVGTPARVVFTEHGRFYPDRYRYKALLINPVLAFMTDAIVAISAATRKALSRYEFIPRAKIRVIYNSINALERDPEASLAVRRELGIPEKDRVLGTVARLDPVKNQTMMLEAFAKASDTLSDVWLLVVGDGPDRESLEARADALGIRDRVIFTGFRPRPAAYLMAMDVFLLSSHTEGTSMTLLEAMSLGIPVVATNVGGNPEIVENGKTGILCQADNAQAFADAIVRLMDNANLRESMGVAGKARFMAEFSIQEMTSRYQNLYHQILEG